MRSRRRDTGTSRQLACGGINRISLGVQSFLTAELRQTGRTHSAELVENEVAMLREAGLTNINIDLIAGLPDQTAASWERSLDWVARLAPRMFRFIFLKWTKTAGWATNPAAGCSLWSTSCAFR